MKHNDLVWRILSGIPVEVFDEEEHSVWSSDLWELTVPRSTGDFTGQRTIGSANIMSAYNLFYLKLLSSGESSENAIAEFKNTLDYLEQNKLIRRRPDRIRATFKTV
jgi:hypothetical protein